MGIPLKVLIVEDSENDALLILRELRREGYDPYHERVQTAEEMGASLEKQSWDIVLSDYVMPRFTGINALKLLQEKEIDIPFILVSGLIGEETAVEAMKGGASDYIMKGNLSRLVPAVKRELREADVRRDRRQVREALKESEILYRTIFETSGTAIVIDEEDTTISLANEEYEKLTGYSKEELEGKRSWTEFIVKEDVDRIKEYHRLRRISPDAVPTNYVFRLIERQGNVKHILATVSMIPETKKSLASLLDITERKKAEEELKKARRYWEDIFQAIGHPAVILNPEHNIMLANHALAKITGKTIEELINKKCYEVFHDTNQPPEGCPMKKMLASKNLEVAEMEMEALGGVFIVSCTPVIDGNGNLQKIIHIATDITDRKMAEKELKRNEKELKKRVQELEEFYNIAVGRELRMKELKEINEALEAELKKYKK
ncbi:MAG: PAS domain S-box protein [Thermodesulfovibrionales bacterium]